ncbi:c-type cytochrome [Thalassospira tepidiphila]|uniref:c-type cytochrome n=1 Tax=Thalassospira tepidiphila TaxID=393657 RepID=UPI0029234105|nr:cytochrome c [Thalassospira tepidiphila]
MRRFMIALLGGLLSAGGVSNVAAQDTPTPDADALQDGRKVAGMCRTCHGLDGLARIPIAPHIGGEPVEYLIAQLNAFKTGKREHEMMTVVASGLSDDQISKVALWFSHFEVSGTLPADTSEDDAPELCVGCHSANGISTLEDAPNLAGETNIYIETQLKAFLTGKRVHDVMTPIAKDLTDAEMQAAADWYSNVAIEISEPPGK